MIDWKSLLQSYLKRAKMGRDEPIDVQKVLDRAHAIITGLRIEGPSDDEIIATIQQTEPPPVLRLDEMPET